MSAGILLSSAHRPLPCSLPASVLQSILNHQLGVYGGDLAISVMGFLYAMFMMVGDADLRHQPGAQPIIGYNYGAERFDRVKKTLELADPGGDRHR